MWKEGRKEEKNGRGGGKKGTGKILNNLSSFEELPPAKGEEGFEK